MKINTQEELVNLEGQKLKDGGGNATLGKCIANMLISAEESGKMKLFILAQKFYKDNFVEVDSSDLILIKNVVGKTKIYNALVAGQIELILEELKEEK